MTCMRIHTEYAQYSIQENKREMLQMIEYSCQQSPKGPAQDYQIDPKTQNYVAKRREQSVVIRDMLSALALCNNVTPVVEQDDKRASGSVPLSEMKDEPLNEEQARKSIIGGMKEPQLEASSPDEVAMVKFGFQLNMSLVERDREYCIMRNAGGNLEEYDVLASFPFTSESKKMGILLKSRETGRVIYYLKGAEVVMEGKIKASARPSLQESCETLALDGLRTLVFAQKLITQ
jgi:phospholipid-translocating ATPase